MAALISSSTALRTSRSESLSSERNPDMAARMLGVGERRDEEDMRDGEKFDSMIRRNVKDGGDGEGCEGYEEDREG